MISKKTAKIGWSWSKTGFLCNRKNYVWVKIGVGWNEWLKGLNSNLEQ